MKFEIKNRWSGELIFSFECGSMRECVEKAVEEGKSLSAADLRDADLSAADLRAADLRAANLRAANLRAANLRAANLRAADLRAANLSAANLRAADLTPIRDDIWAVLSSAPKEVPALRDALIEGRVDGSTYEGSCACLVGTLANARKCAYDEIPGLSPNSCRPAERFFLHIKRGDTPDTNQSSNLALEWVDQWLSNMRSAFAT